MLAAIAFNNAQECTIVNPDDETAAFYFNYRKGAGATQTNAINKEFRRMC